MPARLERPWNCCEFQRTLRRFVYGRQAELHSEGCTTLDNSSKHARRTFLPPSIKAGCNGGSVQMPLFRHAGTNSSHRPDSHRALTCLAPVLYNIQYTVIIARATTRLTMTSQHRGETRKPRSNRSMSLSGEKSLMVVLWVEDSSYTPQSGAKAMTQS